MLGSCVKQRMLMRSPSRSQPWRSTSVVRITSSVSPWRGLRACSVIEVLQGSGIARSVVVGALLV